MENLNAEQIIKALECFHKRILNTNLAEKVTENEIMAVIDALSLIKELIEEYESMAKSVNEASDLILKLKADKKGLINENEELKNQIQEPFFNEEEIDFIDEYTRLLNEGIRDAKANNVSEIKTRFAMRYGTYTDKDTVKVVDVFRLLDQIAQEMLEGGE